LESEIGIPRTTSLTNDLARGAVRGRGEIVGHGLSSLSILFHYVCDPIMVKVLEDIHRKLRPAAMLAPQMKRQ